MGDKKNHIKPDKEKVTDVLREIGDNLRWIVEAISENDERREKADDNQKDHAGTNDTVSDADADSSCRKERNNTNNNHIP